MHVIRARNVNHAYCQGITYLRQHGQHAKSRAGDVLQAVLPVTTVYTHPMERVLFVHDRNANPIFHVMEALWMLAGRKDATWLDQFVSDFSARFAEPDGMQHGAYGFRWRRHFDLAGGGEEPLDQLEAVITALRQNKSDRRVVIQMWDPMADLRADKKDVPCNLNVTPRIVNGCLDITVMCRSNDAIYGAYGANAVHFSVLQEYLAAKIGVKVGTYYQISNNFHLYTDVLYKIHKYGTPPSHDWQYEYRAVAPTSVVTNPTTFDQELQHFMAAPSNMEPSDFTNEFFRDIAIPMLTANDWRKRGELDKALGACANMSQYSDWRFATESWLKHLKAKKEKRDVEDSQ